MKLSGPSKFLSCGEEARACTASLHDHRAPAESYSHAGARRKFKCRLSDFLLRPQAWHASLTPRALYSCRGSPPRLAAMCAWRASASERTATREFLWTERGNFKKLATLFREGVVRRMAMAPPARGGPPAGFARFASCWLMAGLLGPRGRRAETNICLSRASHAAQARGARGPGGRPRSPAACCWALPLHCQWARWQPPRWTLRGDEDVAT